MNGPVLSALSHGPPPHMYESASWVGRRKGWSAGTRVQEAKFRHGFFVVCSRERILANSTVVTVTQEGMPSNRAHQEQLAYSSLLNAGAQLVGAT